MSYTLNAKDALLSLKEAEQIILKNRGGDVTVEFEDTTYKMTEPFVLSPELAELSYSLTLKGKGGATLDGTHDVSGREFQPVDGKPYYVYQLPESLKKDGKYPLLRVIYVNGKMQTLVRGPESQMMYNHTPIEDESGLPTRALLYPSPDAFGDMIVKTADGYRLADGVTLPFELHLRIEWYTIWMRVSAILFDDHTYPDAITVEIDPRDALHMNRDNMQYQFSSRGGRKFNLVNNLALLKTPGEFYYDAECGRLYLCPEDGVELKNATVGLPLCERLLDLSGGRSITLDGLSFTGTVSNYPAREAYLTNQSGNVRRNPDLMTEANKDYIGFGNFVNEAAVFAENITDLSVRGCHFHDIHGYALQTKGITDGVTVVDCDFTHIGGGAVSIGSPSGWCDTNQNKNIHIENNYLRHIAEVFYCCTGILITPVENLKILHNSIVNTSYTAIGIGWRWQRGTWAIGEQVNNTNVEIAYNYIENYMTVLYDGGAIYMLGGNCHIENSTYFNFVHDNYAYCGSTEGLPECDDTPSCWYHDGASSNWHNYHNAVRVEPKTLSFWSYVSLQGGNGYWMKGGQQVHNIKVEDNYFVNLEQDYLTCGHGRVMRHCELYEINSTILSKEDLEAKEKAILADPNHQPYHRIKAKDFRPIDGTNIAEEINSIVTNAGCDRRRGTALILDGYKYKKVNA